MNVDKLASNQDAPERSEAVDGEGQTVDSRRGVRTVPPALLVRSQSNDSRNSTASDKYGERSPRFDMSHAAEKCVSTSLALWTGRIIFMVSLSAVGAVLGALAYYVLHDAERNLAETHFESIADRALTEAAGIAQRKRSAVATMAELTARMLPDPAQWPKVYIDGFTEIASKLLDTVGAAEEVSILTFAPLVRLEEQKEWEEFAYSYYNDVAKYPDGTGEGGIWSYDAAFSPQHETQGNVDGALRNWPFLFPAFQLKAGFSSDLLFSLRSGLVRARAIDSMVECAQQYVLNRSNNNNNRDGLQPANKCGSVTDMHPVDGVENRRLAAVMCEPIFPENGGGPTIFAGFLATVLFMDETLSSVFADSVSGVDAVFTTDHGSAFTYSVIDGIAYPK